MTAQALAANLEAAAVRARQHKAINKRLVIRFQFQPAGLAVLANVPARTNDELHLALRIMPWESLATEHHRLPAMVDEVAAEIDALVVEGSA
jgi:hypothetical protein